MISKVSSLFSLANMSALWSIILPLGMGRLKKQDQEGHKSQFAFRLHRLDFRSYVMAGKKALSMTIQDSCELSLQR